MGALEIRLILEVWGKKKTVQVKGLKNKQKTCLINSFKLCRNALRRCDLRYQTPAVEPQINENIELISNSHFAWLS